MTPEFQPKLFSQTHWGGRDNWHSVMEAANQNAPGRYSDLDIQTQKALDGFYVQREPVLTVIKDTKPTRQQVKRAKVAA